MGKGAEEQEYGNAEGYPNYEGNDEQQTSLSQKPSDNRAGFGNMITNLFQPLTDGVSIKASDEAGAAAKLAGQVTTNPNTRVLFKQVNMREFAFTFKFIPTSQKEAEQVKQIIKLFRSELYPEDIVLPLSGESSISVGYKFPNKFQIRVLYDGQHVATKLKPCFLRDVGVTYNNTAMSMHSDGNFSEIEMTLSFQETRTLNKKDVEEGF